MLVLVTLAGLFAEFVHEVGCTVEINENNGFSGFSTLAVICIVVVFTLVVIIAMCGGCAPMEVGSDTYAAVASSHRVDDAQSNSVVGNINTRVMTSGTTLLNDPYNSRNQTGYQSPMSQQAAGYGNNIAHQPSSYQSGSLYDQSGAMQNHVMRSYSHRHTTESPPPDYSEAVRDYNQVPQ